MIIYCTNMLSDYDAPMPKMQITTHSKRQVIDMTDMVSEHLPPGATGLVIVFVPHSTAAITTANLDPGTNQDLLDALDTLLPKDLQWRHPHNSAHAPDHLLASIVGPEVVVPYERGALQLGAWQRIVMVEFDGPRERTVIVSVR